MSGETIKVKVLRVIDGDTFLAATDHALEIVVRIKDINAPERGNKYFAESKNFLKDLCEEKEIYIQPHKRDCYNRTVADCFLKPDDHHTLSWFLIKEGQAIEHTKYSANDRYKEAQAFAKQKKAGLWELENTIQLQYVYL